VVPTERRVCSPIAFHDIEHRILAQPKPMADFPVRLTFADELENLWCETICLNALPWPAAEHDATLLSRRDP
jgi:hypothetical protein